MTIYDIAKEAGVSASTVSRIINKKGNVKAETRKRVEALLKTYHYSPDAAARALVSQSSKTIGILITDIRTAHHTDSVHYIEGELAKLGYCCIIMNTGASDESKARYIRILSTRRVEGAVLIGSSFQTESVKKAISEYMREIPVVLANGYLDLPNVYCIIADEENGLFRLTQKLVEQGRRHLALVIGNHTPSNALKQRGFETAIRQLFPGTEALIVPGGPALEDARQATKELMRAHPETDGVIYVVDLMAVGGLQAFREMGISVPGQVAVAGVDNSVYAQICTPTLTSLDNKLLDLSIAAAQNLIAALSDRYVTKNMMIISSIVEREST